MVVRDQDHGTDSDQSTVIVFACVSDLFYQLWEKTLIGYAMTLGGKVGSKEEWRLAVQKQQ